MIKKAGIPTLILNNLAVVCHGKAASKDWSIIHGAGLAQ